MIPLAFILLGQLPDPGSAYSIGWLALALLALVGMVNLVVATINGVKRMREGTPMILGGQPLQVRQAAEFVTKPELATLKTEIGDEIQQLHGRLSGLRNDLSGKLERFEERLEVITNTMRSEAKDDTAAVHERINTVLTAVSELRGEMKHLTRK